jgi:hypothetical protein
MSKLFNIASDEIINYQKDRKLLKKEYFWSTGLGRTNPFK